MVSVNTSWSVLGFGIHISDRYSLAVLLWEIYSEKVPWAEKIVSRGQTAIFSTYGAYRLEIISTYSEKKAWPRETTEKRPTEVFKAVVVNTETLNTTILSCSNY